MRMGDETGTLVELLAGVSEITFGGVVDAGAAELVRLFVVFLILERKTRKARFGFVLERLQP